MRSANVEIKTTQSDNFIETVIATAKKTFIPGHAQIKQLESNPIKTLFKPADYKDKRFLRHANWLPDTNFIAAKGPSIEKEMPDFITDTVYNTYRPINQVIALGHCLAYTDYTYRDFYDYIIKERDAVFGPYSVSIKHVSGRSTTSDSAHQIFPHGAIQSQLFIRSASNASVNPRQLNVTLIHLRDNHALDLRHPKKEALKEILWQFFIKSLKEPIMVHCAAGLGRTGHLILMFEILKYYSKIYDNNDPAIAAAKIHDILNDMRSCRPGMVLNEKQFESAIRNASILYSYALEKEYIVASGQHAVHVSSMSLFAHKTAAPEQPVMKMTASPKLQ